ncbi:hypothetical protein BGZ57DRAFT_932459 [Hyaloscypha finlandica]|nr:hypothetical protein BGZ57DRAFT_932459 [Hyaloscypha finlandica]
MYAPFDQSSLRSLPDRLNLVDEQFLEPKIQLRTSKLKLYFEGYKEFLELPPSPTLSDEGELFSYREQSSSNLDKALIVPYSYNGSLQTQATAEKFSNREVQSQVDLSRSNQPKAYSNNAPQYKRGSRRTQRKGMRDNTSSNALKANPVEPPTPPRTTIPNNTSSHTDREWSRILRNPRGEALERPSAPTPNRRLRKDNKSSRSKVHNPANAQERGGRPRHPSGAAMSRSYKVAKPPTTRMQGPTTRSMTRERLLLEI